MSVINEMLRDLDDRHAADPLAGPATRGMSEHPQAVSVQRRTSEFFWRFMAAAMLFAVAWVAWVVWQLMPRPVVTELAYQSARASAPAKVEPAPAAAAEPKAEPAAAPAVAAAPAPQPSRPAVDMLKLATELTTPIPQRRASAPRSTAKQTASRDKIAAAVPVAAPTEPGKIDRRANTSAKNRADQEFRRAVALVNQGRVAESMDGFRAALELDPQHEAARQTLVALLLESKRVDEAATVLQSGLAVNPDNTGFAMLLARIMVERNQVSDALSVLQRHAAPPDRNPDFHAFAGALYQRLGRHPEAIGQYEAALRLAPSAGVWWVGLGISLQAAERRKDAADAYGRAKSAGLSPDLLAFVDQRLKQLQ